MISYTDSLAGITPDQLRGFFIGWRVDPPTPEKHLRILQGSDRVILAIDDQTENVVGFITALTDGELAAFIPLLEVLPAYRRHGIGTELMRRMIDQLRELRNLDLTCDPELEPFYARFGMMPSRGMVVRRYQQQTDARDQERAMEEQFTVPEAVESDEWEAWRAIRDTAAKRRFGQATRSDGCGPTV